MKCSPVLFQDFGVYEVITGSGTHNFPLHTHKSECYGMVTQGNVELFCGDRRLLCAGDTFRIPPSTPHSLTAVDEIGYAYQTICLKEHQNNDAQAGWLFQVKLFILNCPADGWDIDMLSNQVHLSKYHLIRKFKDEYGLSPYQYYMNVRIEKIRQGLLLGQALSDLSYQLGFSDQSHMCNVFKRYMGITPTQYRDGYMDYKRAGENMAKR